MSLSLLLLVLVLTPLIIAKNHSKKMMGITFEECRLYQSSQLHLRALAPISGRLYLVSAHQHLYNLPLSNLQITPTSAQLTLSGSAFYLPSNWTTSLSANFANSQSYLYFLFTKRKKKGPFKRTRTGVYLGLMKRKKSKSTCFYEYKLKKRKKEAAGVEIGCQVTSSTMERIWFLIQDSASQMLWGVERDGLKLCVVSRIAHDEMTEMFEEEPLPSNLCLGTLTKGQGQALQAPISGVYLKASGLTVLISPGSVVIFKRSLTIEELRTVPPLPSVVLPLKDVIHCLPGGTRTVDIEEHHQRGGRSFSAYFGILILALLICGVGGYLLVTKGKAIRSWTEAHLGFKRKRKQLKSRGKRHQELKMPSPTASNLTTTTTSLTPSAPIDLQKTTPFSATAAFTSSAAGSRPLIGLPVASQNSSRKASISRRLEHHRSVMSRLKSKQIVVKKKMETSKRSVSRK